MKIYPAITLFVIAFIITLCGNLEALPSLENFSSFKIVDIQKEPLQNIIMRCGGLLLSIICFGFAYRRFAKVRRLSSNGEDAQGIVKKVKTTRVEKARDDNDEYVTYEYTHEISIDFTDHKGIVRNVLHTRSDRIAPYQEGDQVLIRFNKNDPTDYIIGGTVKEWFASLVLFIISLIILGFTIKVWE